MKMRRVLRSRSQPGVAEPPGADDDPYVLYLRWVEAGRPSADEAESAAGAAAVSGSTDDLVADEGADEWAAHDAVVMPAATPSTGHVNAVDASTGAMASIRRRFRLFGRR
jgi:hypothetical protein